VTVFVRSISDRPKINEIRKEYFGKARPASTLVEISRLASDDFSRRDLVRRAAAELDPSPIQVRPS
jgi:enamine deaminase RidA (YjgF/YER057c/UK114 family)